MIRWLLSWFGGGILNSVLAHFQKLAELQLGEQKLKTEIAIKNVEAQIELNKARQAIIIAQLGHPVAWIPRFLIELFVAFHIILAIIDHIYDLPGEILEFPGWLAAIEVTVIGGMFLKAAADSVVSSSNLIAAVFGKK